MSRVHGIDISSWQTSYTHPTNPPRPVDFVIQRLGYGLNKDEKLKEMTPPTLAEAIKGAYHYPSSAAPWKDQCDFFLERMNGKYDFWAWDPEKDYNGQSLVDGVVPALEYLLKYSGRKGLLYTNPDMWGTWFLPIQQDLLVYDLWVAHYWWTPDPEGIPNYFKVPGGENMRRDWRFWQYDRNGQNGRGKEYGVGSFGLDLDVFNGTIQDLRAWIGITAPPIPTHPAICPTCGQNWPQEAPQPPTSKDYVVIYPRVNVREAPSVLANFVRFAVKGEVVPMKSPAVYQDGYIQLADGNWIYGTFVEPK
jgi:GH25 family lysozyme M1 (1,4-beta-N-acetylmuramidase)